MDNISHLRYFQTIVSWLWTMETTGYPKKKFPIEFRSLLDRLAPGRRACVNSEKNNDLTWRWLVMQDPEFHWELFGTPCRVYLLLVNWFELLCTWSQKVLNWFSVCRQTRRSWGFEIGGGSTSLLSGAENWRQAMHTRFAQFSIQSNLISRSLSLSLSHFQSSQTWFMRSNSIFTEEKYFPMELCLDFIWQCNGSSL